MDTTAVELPALKSKLRVLCAWAGISQAQLAARMGRKRSTLTGWTNGTSKSKADHVPSAARIQLTEILVEEIGGTMTVEAARELWLGSLNLFARAFTASDNPDFIDLLASAPRRSMITFLKGAGARNLVNFQQPGPASKGVISAKIGEAFALEIRGTPGERLIVLVESPSGCHLGVPGAGSTADIPVNGVRRLPDGVGIYLFEPPPGLHRFLVFAFVSAAPLSAMSHADSPLPLFPDQLQRLADELRNRRQVTAWSLDELKVQLV